MLSKPWRQRKEVRSGDRVPPVHNFLLCLVAASFLASSIAEKVRIALPQDPFFAVLWILVTCTVVSLLRAGRSSASATVVRRDRMFAAGFSAAALLVLSLIAVGSFCARACRVLPGLRGMW